MRRGAWALLLLAAAPRPTPAADWLDASDAAGLDFHHRRGASPGKLLPETMGAGGAVLDYDGDGWLDVYLVQSGSLAGEPLPAADGLFRNLGDGRFAPVAARAGLADDAYGQGAVAADYDGDGATDLYVVNFGPNILYRNRGDGTFEDATRAAGVGDERWGSSAAFFDADGDGDLDLYVVNYLDYALAIHRDCVDRVRGTVFYCHPDAYPAAPDVFYRNEGGGRFRADGGAGLADVGGKGLGVVALDFDRDGRQDLYVANDSTPNFLFHNLGGGRFAEVGLPLGAAYNEEGRTEAGMGVDAGDVDGDGWLDLVVTNLSFEANALYRGGPSGFTYASRQAGLYGPSFRVLGFGTDLLDADNDGDLDLFVANGDVLDNVELFKEGVAWRQPAQLFVNDGGGRFAALPASALGPLAEPRVGRGSLTLDYDHDGRLDLAVSYNDDRARLYRNVGDAGHWLALDGVPVGARVELAAGGRVQADEARTASGYQTSGSPRLHFGLGAAARAEAVEIAVGGRARRRLLDLPADRILRLPPMAAAGS